MASCLFVITQILPTNQGDLKQCNISIELNVLIIFLSSEKSTLLFEYPCLLNASKKKDLLSCLTPTPFI